jgi:hypothetical protein
MCRPLPSHPMLILTTLALAACGENATPTQPEGRSDPAPAAVSLGAVPDTWTPTAPPPYDQYTYGYDLGMAPNSAGQSIVYALGGTSSAEGGTGKRRQSL